MKNTRNSKHKSTPAHPGPTSARAQNTRKMYTCSCTQRCKGRPKQITRATYLKHAQFREADSAQQRVDLEVGDLEATSEAGSSEDDTAIANVSFQPNFLPTN